MSHLILWGAGGHGKVVLDVARAMGIFENVSFVCDSDEDTSPDFCGCGVTAARRYLESRPNPESPRFVVSIGKNTVRAERFQLALDAGLLPATLIHPSAVISASAHLGEGTVAMARAVVNAEARVGRNVIVNTAAVIEHDCQIGDHVHLSPGVLLGGGVTVGSFVHIGIGAVVLPGVEVGEGAVVGAGAVVVKPVAPGATVVGVPARPLDRTSH